METLKIKIVVLWVAVICGFCIAYISRLATFVLGRKHYYRGDRQCACWTACLHDGRQLPDTCNWYSLCFIWLP